jgi:MFS family permease
MLQVVRNVISPLLSIGLFMLGSGFFVSFQSILLKNQGYSDLTIGLVHSAYYAGMLVGTLKVEHFIHRVGHIRAMATFASVCAIMILLQSLYQDPYIWVIFRLIVGYCLAGVFVVIESWILDKGTDQTRGQLLSLYMVAFYSAQAGGQLFLELYPIDSLQPFILASLLCCCGIVPVVITKSKSPEIHEPQVKKTVHVLFESPFGFLGCVIAGLILSAIYSFGPNFAQSHDVSPGLMMGTIIMGGVILQIPMGRLSDLFDRRSVLMILALLTVVPCFVIPFVTHDSTLLFLTLFVLGGLSFTLYPVSLAQSCDRIDPKVLTSVTAVLLMAFGIGSVIGPLISPYFMFWYGSVGLFYYVAVMSSVLVLIGFASIYLFKKVPAEQQNAFIALPRSSPILYDLDPRGKPLEEVSQLKDLSFFSHDIYTDDHIKEGANHCTEKTPH